MEDGSTPRPNLTPAEQSPLNLPPELLELLSLSPNNTGGDGDSGNTATDEEATALFTELTRRLHDPSLTPAERSVFTLPPEMLAIMKRLPDDKPGSASESHVLDAMNRGQRDVLQKLATEGVDLNGAPGTFPPLFLAISQHNLDAVKFLVEDQSVTLEFDTDWFTPELHNFFGSLIWGLSPINLGGPPLYDVMRDAYRDFVHRPDRKVNALHAAASLSSQEILEYILEKMNSTLVANVDLWNEPFSPFHLAINSGRLEAVKTLAVYADVDAGDGFLTPLHIAVFNESLDIVEYLLEECQANARVKCADQNYEPLHLAVVTENVPLIQALLKHGAEGGVDECDGEGNTPLHLACLMGTSLETVECLLEHGASLTVTNIEGDTPLHVAAFEWGRLGVVQSLVQHDADVNALDSDGCTPLYLAAQNGHLDIVKFLVEHGADVNLGKFSPLSTAIYNRHVDIVIYLIEKGPAIERDDHTKSNYINNLLRDAVIDKEAKESALEVVTYLIEVQGADPEYRDELGSNLIALAAERNQWDVVTYLNGGVRLPLHEAAGLGNREVVQALLVEVVEESAIAIPVDSKDAIGMTPLQLAAHEGHTEVVKLLLEHGANPAATNFHASVLHYACAYGTENSSDAAGEDGPTLPLVLAALKAKLRPVEFIAHLNSRDSTGDTPLVWAIQSDNLAVARTLVEHGADPRVRNEKGETAFDWARKSDKVQEFLALLGPEPEALVTTF